ncbi:DNA starvation/stationary phase protection protein Dps [soil metagenome]
MPKSFPTRNDLPAKTRTQVTALLNQQLQDLIDLYTQTKYAHWNVKGPNFIAIHELFDKFAETLEDEIDDTAERATALGAVALGTTRQVAESSRVKEFPGDNFEGLAVVAALADRYATVGKSTRAAIETADDLGDKDTADLFTGTSRELDKALWFLEAHLAK